MLLDRVGRIAVRLPTPESDPFSIPHEPETPVPVFLPSAPATLRHQIHRLVEPLERQRWIATAQGFFSGGAELQTLRPRVSRNEQA
jgi:hypothetical protein